MQYMAADRHGRRGFALLVAIMFVAVVAVLAAVVTVNLSGDNDTARVQKANGVLLQFSREINSIAPVPAPSFRSQVGVNPGRLSHLMVQIVAADLNSCGNGYLNPQRTAWRGPYHLVPFQLAGYAIAPGFFANNQLVRVSATRLAIVMNNVAFADAQLLGLIAEGNSTGTGPLVTFTPVGTNPVTVSYNVVISSC